MSTQPISQRIINYVDLILRKPKRDVKFFSFDSESGKSFIVDGSRIKLLPLEYHKYYTRDEFFIHIDPIGKNAMFYAYDIEDYSTGKHVHEDEGFFKWEDIEQNIYNFFVLHIKELTDIIAPYLEVQDSKPSHTQIPGSYSSMNSNNNHSGFNYNNQSYNTTGYGSPAYKEREAFYDKLWALLKDNKTSQAMDYIGAHITQMCADKKFEDLDSIFRLINFDKLNIPTMIGMLDCTKDSYASLKERKDFFNKVKTHITKIKPTRAASILNKYEIAIH